MFAAFYGADLLSATWKDVESWLESRPLMPSSRADYLSYLHCFYEWAIREELTEHDPTVRVPVPRVPRRLPRPIGEGSLARAFMEADPRMMAMLALAAYAGLRCMEIADLCANDILWGSPVVVIIRGKGDKDRVVPLCHKADLALRAYGVPSSGPVFPKLKGGHYNPSTVSIMINTHLHRCGIPETAHQLRHRFGTRFYRESKDIMLTKEMMGHSSITTTQGYVAYSPDAAAKVVEAL